MSEGFDDDGLLPQVLPPQPPPRAPGRSRTYAPWHKPRKQWIRRHQWHAEVRQLLADTHFPADGRIFRYLSMPGEDLLDVRVLREACEEAGVQLRFTGLNAVKAGSADDLQLNLAESAVRGLANVHSGSQVLREMFQNIADKEALAHQEVANSGPFNAINVDLCDHLLLREQDGSSPTIIDAIARIIENQIEQASQPWLLFITTRIRPGSVERRNLAALMAAIADNISRHDQFAQAASSLLELEAGSLQAALEDPDQLDPGRFKTIFTLGFGKWLLAYLDSAQPRCGATQRPSCFYSVHAGQPDMLSLAYRVEVRRSPPADRYNIVGQNVAAVPQEAELAIELLHAVREVFDLDEYLAGDQPGLEQAVNETESLLRDLNYPVDDPAKGYRPWLATKAGAPRPR